jgi:hypothetical protein
MSCHSWLLGEMVSSWKLAIRRGRREQSATVRHHALITPIQPSSIHLFPSLLPSPLPSP